MSTTPRTDELAKRLDDPKRAPKGIGWGQAMYEHAQQLERELTALQVEQRWIRVDERLPDDDVTVLLLMDDGEVWTGFHDGDEGWRYVSAEPAGNVKAWKPMPGGE